jgi:superkiller protein 3
MIPMKIAENDMDALMDKGLAYYKHGQHEEAVKCFDKVLTNNPKRADALYAKGIALAGMKRLIEAIDCFDSVLKINPQIEYVWRNKGICLHFLDRYNEAIICYDKAIELDPTNEETWTEKGRSLSMLKQFEAAIECYQESLDLDPGNDEVWCDKGNSLGCLSRYKEAIICFDKALKINPDNEMALFYKQMALKAVNQPGVENITEQLEQLDKEIEQRPNDNIPWKRKGILLLNAEDGEKLKEAVDFFDEAIRRDPKDDESYIYKGQMLFRLNRFEDALDCFDNALKINKYNGIIYSLKMGALQALNQYEEAKKCYAEGEKLFSSKDNEYLQQGKEHAENGRHGEAVNCFTKVIELNPGETEAWYRKGGSLFELELYQEAIDCYEKCMTTHPIEALYCKGRALVLLHKDGKDHGSMACFDDALKLNPYHKFAYKIWYLKGLLSCDCGNYEEALPYLDKSIKLNSGNEDAWKQKREALCSLNRFNEAIACYDRFFESDLNETDIAMYKGNYFLDEGESEFEGGNYGKAVAYFNKVIKTDPQNEAAWLYTGLALMELECFNEAVYCFDKTIELVPNEVSTFHGKLMALIELNRGYDAIACCDKIIELDPSEEKAWFYKACIKDPTYPMFRLIDKNEAIVCLDKVIEINPENDRAWSEKGDVLNNLYRYQEAVHCSDRAIELNPENEEAWFTKGYALYYCERYEEALACLEKVIALDPDYAEAWRWKQNILEKLSGDNTTVESLIKAVELDKSGSELSLWNLWLKAEVFLNNGLYGDAVKCFDACLNKTPNDIRTLQRKGLALVKSGRYEEAVQCYAKTETDILSTFLSLKNTDDDIEEKKRLEPFLDKMLAADNFFRIITKDINGDLEPYKKIYIKSFLIISLLFIDFHDEEFVAHYTSDVVAKLLLVGEDNSPLRLSLVTASNDPKEGQSLLDYFFNRKTLSEEQTKIIETEFGAFSTSFTFNPDHQGQFSQYGISSKGIKAGGVSLVIKKDFFNTRKPDNSNYYESILERLGKEEGLFLDKSNKLYQNMGFEDDNPGMPLFRCIYIEPAKGLVFSIGQREEDTLYQDESEKDKLLSYQHKINRILEETRYQLEEIKKAVVNLDPKIIGQLLLSLRYLTKDVFFKGEQECRIITVKRRSEAKPFFPKSEKMFFDYLKMEMKYLEKIILGAKCSKEVENDLKNAGIENIDHSKLNFE